MFIVHLPIFNVKLELALLRETFMMLTIINFDNILV